MRSSHCLSADDELPSFLVVVVIGNPSLPPKVDLSETSHGPAFIAAHSRLRNLNADSAAVEHLINAIRPASGESLEWARVTREVASIAEVAVEEELEATKKHLEKSKKMVDVISNKVDSLARQLDQASHNKLILDVVYQCMLELEEGDNEGPTGKQALTT
ncbi:hypothetical protein BU15DRAFT_74099 [Melanogaster broomeanus]|nr:hypothetical protein BU15DRAFT_74099 [Melanogaster broomeanus]